jgi:hypothetical protein
MQIGGRSIQYLYIEILTFPGRKTKLQSEPAGELRDDHKLSEFESGGDDFLTECGDVVLVCVPDLLYETVRPESLEQT